MVWARYNQSTTKLLIKIVYMYNVLLNHAENVKKVNYVVKKTI